MDSTCLKTSGIGGNSIIARNGLLASTWKGVGRVHDVVHTICLGIGIEDRSYRVDYSGTLWRRKYRCRYGTWTLEVVQK